MTKKTQMIKLTSLKTLSLKARFTVYRKNKMRLNAGRENLRKESGKDNRSSRVRTKAT